MNHEFFQKPFPERMPVSTLSIPPSSEFLSKYPSMGVTVNKTSDMMGKSPWKAEIVNDKYKTASWPYSESWPMTRIAAPVTIKQHTPERKHESSPQIGQWSASTWRDEIK